MASSRFARLRRGFSLQAGCLATSSRASRRRCPSLSARPPDAHLAARRDCFQLIGSRRLGAQEKTIIQMGGRASRLVGGRRRRRARCEPLICFHIAHASNACRLYERPAGRQSGLTSQARVSLPLAQSAQRGPTGSGHLNATRPPQRLLSSPAAGRSSARASAFRRSNPNPIDDCH